MQEGGKEGRRRKKRYLWYQILTYSKWFIFIQILTLCRACNTMLVMLAPLVWSEVSTTRITLQWFTWKHTRTTKQWLVSYLPTHQTYDTFTSPPPYVSSLPPPNPTWQSWQIAFPNLDHNSRGYWVDLAVNASALHPLQHFLCCLMTGDYHLVVPQYHLCMYLNSVSCNWASPMHGSSHTQRI